MSQTKENERKLRKANADLTRRQALSKMGMAAVGAGAVVIVGGVAYYLSTSQAPPGPPPTTTTAATTAATTSQVMTTPTGLPPAQDPIILNSWDYHPEVIREFVAYYEQKNNDKVNYSVVTAADYFAAIETKLISETPLDIYYSTLPRGQRHYKAGWARDVEDFPDIKQIKADIAPGFVENIYSDPDTGKMFCLPYHLGTILMFTNEKVRKAAGFADTDEPKTWDELYDQCRAMKAKGVAEPLVPRWEPTFEGITYGFAYEAMNRGDPLFDKNLDPVFDTNTPLGDMLQAWKAAWDDKLVPRGVLSWSYADYLASFAAGGHAYSLSQMYDMRVYNDPKQSGFAPYCSLVPMDKQPWGGLEPTVYMTTNRERSSSKLERTQRFVEFLSWTDFYVGKKWAEIASLVWAYPKIFDDPSYKDIFMKTTTVYRESDYDEFKKQMTKITIPPHWRTLWGAEFDNAIINNVPKGINGDMSVNDLIALLRKTAQDLKKTYAA